MDETGILVGLRRGIRLYRRHDLHLLWTAACGNEVEGLGNRVSSVALTADLVLILPLPPTGPLWNESTCTHLLALQRTTGKMIFSHKLVASATAILPGCKSFVLFPNAHPKYPELACYKVCRFDEWELCYEIPIKGQHHLRASPAIPPTCNNDGRFVNLSIYHFLLPIRLVNLASVSAAHSFSGPSLTINQTKPNQLAWPSGCIRLEPNHQC